MTVFFRISLIVISPIELMCFAGSLPYVRNKLPNIIHPLVTYGDTASTVVLPVLAVGIQTSLFNVYPNSILWLITQSVFESFTAPFSHHSPPKNEGSPGLAGNGAAGIPGAGAALG